MPDTSLGITYPDSSGHGRLWEHFQELAADVNTLIAADRTSRDAAPSTYTPVITGATSGTWSAGATTIVGNYIRTGRRVKVWVDLTLGASVSISGSVTGNILISLPVAAAALTPGHIGTGLVIEATPAARWGIVCQLQTTTTIVLVKTADGGIVGNTQPSGNVFASGDIIRFEADYLAAAAP